MEKLINCLCKELLLTVTLLVVGTPSLFANNLPNILLIVSEDNGPELGCYGDDYARTPNLDRLASGGVRFENAFVPYSVCSPSRAAFLTGLHPHQNGQIGLATHKFAMYDEATPNIVTHLNAAEYHTGLIGKLHVNPESAFPFDSHQIPSSNFQRRQSIQDYADAAKKFINEAGEKPFFLSVNFPDAHLPFLRKVNGRPTEPLDESDVQPMPWVGVNSPRLREQVANYYNCLERLDTGVGMLLETLNETGHADNTLIIYFGDHGAQFPRGKGTVYEGGLRVPMIVHWPGQTQAGTVREELVSTLDVLPTILNAAGLEVPEELPGFPLQPLLKNETPPTWRKYSFALTTGSFPRACFVQESVRDQRYKLISSPQPNTENLDANTYLDEKHQHYVVSGATAEEQAASPKHVQNAFALWSKPPRYELYDLENDPYEWNNLAENPAHSETLNRLKKALRDWQIQTRAPFLEQKHVDDFVNEQLANRDLKYRKKKDFRWSYLDQFSHWRAEQLNSSQTP